MAVDEGDEYVPGINTLTLQVQEGLVTPAAAIFTPSAHREANS